MRIYERLEQEVRTLMGEVSITEIMGNPKLVESFERALGQFARSRGRRSIGLEREVRRLIEAISDEERRTNLEIREPIACIERYLGQVPSRI